MFRVEHDCELNLGEDDILFLPSRGFCNKLVGTWRQAFMASQKNPNAIRYLRSRASIIFERRRHLRSYHYAIHPFSLFTHWWNFLMALTLTCALTSIAYQASYDMLRTTPAWTIVKTVMLLFCCLDVIVNSVTGYYVKLERFVMLERKEMLQHYMKNGTFLPDLIGSFPTDLFFVGSWSSSIVARELLSTLIVFRAFSLYKYIGRLAETYRVPGIPFGSFQMTFWLIMGLHWQTCALWIVPIVATSSASPVSPKSGSWIHVLELWNETRQWQYSGSLLYSASILTRSGYIRTPPTTVEDQYLVVISHVISTFVFAVYVAIVMRLTRGSNSSRLKYHAMTAQLKQYMRCKQLNANSQRRFLTHHEFRYQRRYFHENEILGTISAQIRQEIGMHSCRKLVENVTFFNNLPISLLIRIVSLLHSEIFLANDVIVRANQPGDCMYFIASGTVAIYTSSGKEVCHLEDGAHFGEIALVMPDERRVASVVAVEVCELYRLERADFARTIHPYPMLWERIRKVALERHEKTMILNAQ